MPAIHSFYGFNPEINVFGRPPGAGSRLRVELEFSGGQPATCAHLHSSILLLLRSFLFMQRTLARSSTAVHIYTAVTASFVSGISEHTTSTNPMNPPGQTSRNGSKRVSKTATQRRLPFPRLRSILSP